MYYRIVTLFLICVMVFGLHGTVAQAATTTVRCSVSGTITITDNSVRRHNACTGTAIVPPAVTSIGDAAFADASALTAITIPAGVTIIGQNAFERASSLATVTFAAGSKLTSIGAGAFSGASALTAIIIPAGITSIGVNTFKGARRLVTFTFAAGSKLTSIGGSAFRDASALTAISIPAGVTSIGYLAFYNASSLATVTIPAEVTSIGDYAFHNASALSSVYYLGDKPTIASDAFSGVSGASAYIRSTATGYPVVGSLMNGLTVAVGVYTLTYNTKGGSAIAPGVVLQGLPISAPTAPTRSGYTFGGWSASDGGSTLTFPYTPSTASDITLYAKWIK